MDEKTAVTAAQDRGPGPVPTTGEGPPREARPRLLRSRGDRVIGGVCSGLARYLGVDPILVRIAAVALALSGGSGILAYIIAWIVIPEATPQEDASPARARRSPDQATITMLVGAALVAVGALLLLNRVVPWLDGRLLWPVVLVAVGASIVLSGRGRRS